MFRLKFLEYTTDNKSEKINFIRNYNESKFPYISLIIGANGTGKSILLNRVSEVFRKINNSQNKLTTKKYSLEYKIGTETKHITSDDKNIDVILPTKLIVTSFLVNDKFTFENNIEKDFYQYHGIRSTPTGVGTKTHIKKLSDYIISNSDNDFFMSKVSIILKFLKMKNSIDITFKLKSKRFFFLKEDSISIDFLEDYFLNWTEYSQRVTEPFSYNKFKNFKEENKVKDIKSIIDKLTKKHKNNKVTYKLDFKNYKNNTEFSNDYETIKLLMELDLVSSPELDIVKDSSFSINYASSGELHILYTFISILSSIEQNSLILIDEPEISLHPNWQIKYIPFLQEFFKEYNSCHFIIASHSHFMVSDLDVTNSTIIAMRYDQEKNMTYPETLDMNTYALSAENILYNIFNTRTTNNYYLDLELHKVLNLISKENSDINEIKNIYNNLEQIKLDEDDPINIVLKKINQYLISSENA
jgi:predicted ATPase